MGLPRFRPPPPRQQHTPAIDLMRKAQLRHTRITEPEIRETMDSVQICATRLREGVATELQVQVLRSTMDIALEIEDQKFVRGMRGHFEAAIVALVSITTRAEASGTWRPTPLHWYEMDAITSAIDLHDHQLRQLTAAELHKATQRVIARTQSQGGGHLRIVTPTDITAGSAT